MQLTARTPSWLFASFTGVLSWVAVSGAALPGLQIADIYKLQSVGDVQASPDGTHIAYSIQSSDQPERPESRLWIMDVHSRRSWRVGPDAASAPRWLPDGRLIAFFGRDQGEAAIMVAKPTVVTCSRLHP